MTFCCQQPRQHRIHFNQGRQSWRFGGGRDPQILGREVVGVEDGSWNIIISYHVQELCSKVVTFEEKWNNLLRSCCKLAVFAWKINFLWNCLRNRNFFTRIHDPQIDATDFNWCPTGLLPAEGLGATFVSICRRTIGVRLSSPYTWTNLLTDLHWYFRFSIDFASNYGSYMQTRRQDFNHGVLARSQEGLHVWFCTFDGYTMRADEGLTVLVEGLSPLALSLAMSIHICSHCTNT